MDQFSEENERLLLNKEWLVKIDPAKSTPYLFKFYSSTIDLSCFILITDTKSVWTEVVNSNQLVRRWMYCNRNTPPFEIGEEGHARRVGVLELLNAAHTLGGISDFEFEVVETQYSDFAFTLECELFKWRWETNYSGHKSSADIISKQLIYPLISVNHMMSSSSNAINQISDSDAEKAVDKIGRAARRTVDTHVKNSLSKPRAATTLARMTAMFNFIPDLPTIISAAENSDLQAAFQVASACAQPNAPSKADPPRSPSIQPSQPHSPIPKVSESSLKPTIHTDSATESEGDEDDNFNTAHTPAASAAPSSHNGKHKMDSPDPSASSEALSKPLKSSKEDLSKAESPSTRPKAAKKARISSSDDDSSEENKNQASKTKDAPGPAKRGARQPIKRGGKRF